MPQDDEYIHDRDRLKKVNAEAMESALDTFRSHIPYKQGENVDTSDNTISVPTTDFVSFGMPPV